MCHIYHVLHYVPDIVLSLFQRIILTTVEVDTIFTPLPHFTDEETEGQGSKITCLRSQSGHVQPDPPIPAPSFLNPIYFHRHVIQTQHSPHPDVLHRHSG